MVLLAGLVLALGPAGDRACLASDDAGGRLLESPSAIESDFIPAGDANWKAHGPADRSQFGQAVASVGNVDGSHFDDILVGAPVKGASQGEGTAYLFLNTGGGLNTTPAWEKSSGVQGAYFGYSVAGAGDVNDDGIDDAIIGAPGYKTEFKVGRAFVYQGVQGVGLTIEHTWSYTGTVQDADLGHAVAGAGDVNGDGIDDIVVGAPYYNVPDTEDSEGAIYVFFGHAVSGPSADPDWLIESNQPGAWFGWSVSAAGDVNHDGYDDLLVGAPRYVNPETSVREGAVFLFLGRGTGAVAPASVADAAWVAYGWQEYALFGASVASAGDVNGNGHPDIVVGAPGYDRLFIGEMGAAFAFCGNGSAFDSDPCWTAYGSSIGGRFGTAVAGAGDVNADGFNEVIVGAPMHLERLPDGTQPEGAAFIYFGSATGLSPWAGWKARGDKSRTDFGASVGSAGQVTTDNVDSVFVGAPQYFINEVPWGAAFAFYGPIEPAALNRVFLPLVLRNSG